MNRARLKSIRYTFCEGGGGGGHIRIVVIRHSHIHTGLLYIGPTYIGVFTSSVGSRKVFGVPGSN